MKANMQSEVSKAYIDVEPTAQPMDNTVIVGEQSAARGDSISAPIVIDNVTYVAVERLRGTFDSEQAEQALQALNGMRHED